MPDSAFLVEGVATAVADGHTVDWDSVERSLKDTPEGGLVRSLRQVHSMQARRGAAQEAMLESHDSVFERLLRLLALAQIVVAGASMPWTMRHAGVVPWILHAGALLAYALVGGILAWRSTERRGRRLGLFFLLMATAFAQPFIEPAAHAQHAWAALLISIQPEMFFPLLLWLFVRDFPRTVRLSRADEISRVAALLAASIGGACFVANWYAVRSGLDPLRRGALRAEYWFLLAVLTLGALAVAGGRAKWASLGERRRVAFFMSAIVLGLAPVFSEIVLEVLIPSLDRMTDAPTWQWLGALVLLPPLISIPFSTAYAVTAHRVLPVGQVVRLAGAYALARGTLLLLTLAPTAWLVLALVRSPDRSLREATSGLWPWLASSLVAGGLLLIARESLLRGIDRVFWRRHQDLQSALASAGERIMAATDARSLSKQLDEDLRTTLSVERSAVLVVDPGVSALVASLRNYPSLEAESALVALLSVGDGALNVDPEQRASSFPLLPRADREWIAQTGCCLLVPLRAGQRGLIGCIAVNAKRSDTPFSRPERLFLRGLSTPVAMALAQWDSKPMTLVSDEAAFQCRSCGTVGLDASRCRDCDGEVERGVLPRRLLDKFVVQRLLGRGGMGLVYLCTDLSLERDVAIKTLPRLSDDAAVRLRREARATARLTHPNIAAVHGLESWEGRPLLVVEYLPRGTLADRIASGPQEAVGVLALGCALADAVETLHSAGALHGDVKPSNVGFSAQDVPKLLDFGLSRLAQDGHEGAQQNRDESPALDSSLGHFGTPLYLPPESLLGELSSGAANDLWALALTVYECLAGRHPFVGACSLEELRQLLSKGVPDVRLLRPDVPALVADWLGSALAMDPVCRPATALDMREALAGIARRLA